MKTLWPVLLCAVVINLGCNKSAEKETRTDPNKYRDYHDYHSYANPEKVRVRHVVLDLAADFNARTLTGSSLLTVERNGDDRNSPLVLDTRDLKITAAESSTDGSHSFAPAKFTIGKSDPLLGAPLTIELPASVTH